MALRNSNESTFCDICAENELEILFTTDERCK
jgi:hypothetical protein